MPRFAYYGRDKDRQPVRGTLEASSPANVVEWMTQTGLTPVTVEAVAEVREASDVMAGLFGRDRVTMVELMMITRQLYTMTKASAPAPATAPRRSPAPGSAPGKASSGAARASTAPGRAARA